MTTDNTTTLRLALLRGAAAAALTVTGVAAPSALAQDQAADDGEPEQVIVTGSRIARAGYDTLQPAIEVNSELLEARSFTSVADALNEVPAFGDPIAGSNVGGQSGQTVGSAFVNAFGLGTQRTLTLINGRRVVGQNRVTTGFAGAGGASAGASLGLQVDLNIIPTALIDRVETIFIGGSPAYGSDAVAGTVNVILKDDYQGAEADFQYSRPELGEGDTYRFSTLIGGNFDGGRGNIVMAADYVNANEIIAGDAGFVTRQEVNNPADTGPNDGIPDNILVPNTENIWGLPNTGAPLPVPGFWTGPREASGGNTFFEDTNGNGVFGDAGDESLFFNPAGDGFITYEDNADILGTNIDTLFFAAGGDCRDSDLCTHLTDVNTVQQQTQRWTFNSVGHYDLTDNVRFVFEGLFARTESEVPTQPRWSSFTFNPTSLLQIRIDDPVTGGVNEGNPFVNDAISSTIQQQLPDLITDADRDGVSDVACGGEGEPDCVGDGVPDLNLDTNGDGVPDQLGFFLTRSNFDLTGLDRQSRNQNVFRFVQGFEGDFFFADRNFSWDATFNYGQSNATTQQQVVNDDRFGFALDTVIDPNSGEVVCRVSLDLDGDGQPDSLQNPQSPSFQSPKNISDGFNDVADCVPFNPIGFQPGQQEARDYILGQQIQETRIRQSVVEANIVTELFELPAGPIDVAAGVTYRRERANFDVDAFTLQQSDGGDPTLPVEGEYNTQEIYGESIIPLLGEGFTVRGVSSLQVEGAARFVDNSVAGDDTTWTVGGRTRFNVPVMGPDSLTLRGNFTQSVRAPSIVELFAPLQAQGIFANDPCDERFINEGPNPEVRRANCEAQVAQLIDAGALSPDFTLDGFQSLIVNSGQRSFTGGNPDLENEVADSWTVGGVLTPAFIPGMTISIDWTRIKLTDAIININGNQVLAACYDTPGLPAAQCDRFSRSDTFQVVDPITGFTNAALRDFAGLVANVAWDVPIDQLPVRGGAGLPGALNIQSQFFHTHRHEQSTTEDDLDIFAGEGGFEKFRFQINTTYELNRLQLLWQTRYIGGGIVRNLAAPEFFQFPTFNPTQIYNLGANYQLTDNFNVRLTIDNVFDERDSPRLQAALTDDSGNNGRFRDVIGRTFIFGVTARF